jgi:hypothetical protein
MFVFSMHIHTRFALLVFIEKNSFASTLSNGRNFCLSLAKAYPCQTAAREDRDGSFVL